MARSFLSFFLILFLIPGSSSAELRLVCQDDVLPPMVVSECCCMSQTGDLSCDASRLAACCCDAQIVLVEDGVDAVFPILRSFSSSDVVQHSVLCYVVDADLLYAAHPARLLKFPPVVPRSSPSLFIFHSAFLI